MSDVLKKIYDELNIQSDHVTNYKLTHYEQPPLNHLEVVDIDFEGKPFILSIEAGHAWQKMRSAAKLDGVAIDPFSGFRSYLYQRQLIKRKLERGKPLEVILTETAIPGFSEHHSGRAVDICTNQKFELTEDFEKTSAFEWLVRNAQSFNYRMSYPRQNDLNIVYEPWHWFFVG